MKKISYRPDTWNAETGQVAQDRSTNPPVKYPPEQPQQAKPEIKKMHDGNWMVSKPTGNPGEFLRQLWDKNKKNKIREWTSAKDKRAVKTATPVADWVARQMAGDIVDNKAIEQGYGDSESFPNPPTPEELTRETVLEAIESKKQSKEGLTEAGYLEIIKKASK